MSPKSSLASKSAMSTGSAGASASTAAGATTKTSIPAHVYAEPGWSQDYFSPATEQAHNTITEIVSKDSQSYDS